MKLGNSRLMILLLMWSNTAKNIIQLERKKGGSNSSFNQEPILRVLELILMTSSPTKSPTLLHFNWR